MELWDIVKRSTYECNSIDGRVVGKRKWDNDVDTCVRMPWSRDDLVRSCKSLWKPRPCFPYGLRKRKYANALVLLRVLLRRTRRLEQRSVMRSIKSDTCPICKDILTMPVFGCNESGYHLLCIRNHILVSHSFRDPISRREYTDAELKWCDTMALRHTYQLVDCKYEKVVYMRKEVSVYRLKYDPNRIQEDREQKVLEEDLEIIIDCIEQDIDALKTVFDNNNLAAVPTLTNSLEYHFSLLARQCKDTALRMAAEFVHKYEETDNSLANVLRDIQNKICEWARDAFDDTEMKYDSLAPLSSDIASQIFMQLVMGIPPAPPPPIAGIQLVPRIPPPPASSISDIPILSSMHPSLPQTSPPADIGDLQQLQGLMLNVVAASRL